MAEDIFPEGPHNLVKVCVSQDDCWNAKYYADKNCKYNIRITELENLPVETIKVNETRFIIPKFMMDKIENEHEWNSLNPMRSKLEKDVVIAQHNVDDDNYGFLIVDKSTFKNEILTAHSVLRNELKWL